MNKPNQKDRKFQNKMNNLQSVIGLSGQSSHCLCRAQIREHDRKALEQQALDFKNDKQGLLKRLGAGLINNAAKLFTLPSKHSRDSSRTHVLQESESRCQ
jgi:hypothetical protein